MPVNAALALPAPFADAIPAFAPILLFAIVYVVLLAVVIGRQRKARKVLFELAAELGWSGTRKPHLSNDAVRGMWNGRAAAFGWQPPSRYSPARISARMDSGRPGTAEIRSRPSRGEFLTIPVKIFGPPRVELFDPADSARYCAWASDRSVVDVLLGIPGIREALDANLQDRGVLTLRKGRLEIRRLFTPTRPRVVGKFAFRGGPDVGRLREIAAQEWGLLSKIAG